LDSLSDAPSSLRLSLSTPEWTNVGTFKENATQALESLVDSARDSLSFAVLSWVFSDSGLSSDDWGDSVAQWNRRFLIFGDTLARLPAPTAADTIMLQVRGAYSLRAGLQANPLTALRGILSKGKGHRHLVEMRMLPLAPKDPADTVPAMLRLGGQWSYDISRRPALLFGRAFPADSLDGNNRVEPMDVGNGNLGVSYTLRYAGPRNDLVVPLQRGLHVTLDRARLLDSLEAALSRQGIVPPKRATGSLSLQYYVPFAAITLPIRPPALEAGLPVQVRMFSAVDTLLGDTLGAGTRVDSIPLGHSVTAWYTTEIGHPETIVNDVSLKYDSIASLRRVILAFSKDSVRNDTVFLPPGGHGQITASLTGYGTGNQLFIELQDSATALIARSYLSVRSGLENTAFRDPVSGDPMPLDSLVPRFVQPGSDSIRLRATGGIRSLLNRTGLGTKARQDFEFRPYFRAFNPKAVDASGDTLAREVAFPVLSVIPPRIDSSRLSVDLDVYLYPLKAR
jgi:hypothetical protein